MLLGLPTDCDCVDSTGAADAEPVEEETEAVIVVVGAATSNRCELAVLQIRVELMLFTVVDDVCNDSESDVLT